MKKFHLCLLTAAAICIFPLVGLADEAGIKPVTVGQEMPGFTLTDHMGNEVNLSDYRGRNVMLVFPRGKVDDHWCQICHYQYAELAALEEENHLRDKYGLVILFVLPYGAEEVKEWVSIFPHQMKVIDGWKNPPEDKKDDASYQDWAKTARILFARDFRFEEGKVQLPFPVLVDAERKLSKGLDLFRTEWDHSKVDQNVSTIFIIDRKGVVVFKYFSQNTMDRPPVDYIVRMLDCMK